MLCCPTEDGKIKDDLGEFYHKPAANISQQKKSEKIREKLELRKEKRKIEQKYVKFMFCLTRKSYIICNYTIFT